MDSFGAGEIWNPYLQMAITPHPNAGIPDASRTYAPTTPPEDLPDGPKPAQAAKRVAHEDISTRDSDNVTRSTEDGDGRRKKAKRAPSGTVAGLGSGAKKFACPYFKRNPKIRNWTPPWAGVGRSTPRQVRCPLFLVFWTLTARRTHLYRRHPLPIQCPRCWDVFKADSQLQLHLQQDPPCTVQENGLLHEGFTKDQEKRLRSRKKTHADMTDEDKWREIYTILFPDDDPSSIPSPHYNEDDGEGSSHEGSGELEDYATFIRREMPTLVRRELETLFQGEFRDVEERLRPRIAEIVLNLQPRLLRLYKQSQMPLSEYGPQSSSEPTLTPALSQGMGSGASSGTPITAESGGFITGTTGAVYDDLGLGWASGQGTQFPETEGLGVNWDFEFDRLLKPMLFVPQEMECGQAGGVPFQGL
ncbi:hypothetical protein MMYC01_201557 [Madurella mycetomatis]|uniref:C2H2-type domain-containing protein n=1 Tax=Madurella mycetomatis TaxID=100816 RepID=A0A175WGV5_9PEZI|nr:hypothetical protein MMYC01_201557 [Madurella mycetomatis]